MSRVVRRVLWSKRAAARTDRLARALACKALARGVGAVATARGGGRTDHASATAARAPPLAPGPAACARHRHAANGEARRAGEGLRR